MQRSLCQRTGVDIGNAPISLGIRAWLRRQDHNNFFALLRNRLALGCDTIDRLDDDAH